MTGSSTAVAHSNIALIKYWGKVDSRLAIPATSSVSLTLDAYRTETTVEWGAEQDSVVLDGAVLSGVPADRVSRFLDLVRDLAGRSDHATVVSRNTVPTAAGLASSASGFAALAAAATSAAGLTLAPRDLSILARKGSGSASRSVFGGLAVWYAGTDDLSSYAEPLVDPGLDLAMVVAVVNAGTKEISSRDAMRLTAETSPYYDAWVSASRSDFSSMLDAIGAGDFTRVGELAESNAMRMHASMLGSTPPVTYWEPDSVRCLRLVRELRSAGAECYATMDAGPNVKILCRRPDLATIRTAVEELGVAGVTTALPGPGVRIDRATA
ncbi:diphosphomevalonate decarboxylase [Labedella endophytica]|uniref:diphosphomevalonate decarboxylase n=1 Tax=Labedella endophytica TaxID=1523160 RepID=A0A433JND9_9MICO|nr:diphosphomevalonate decarboxylase [Labedella endophytica]RUQ97540.1 diphosphomevalonate decarboxylase [Labedella endophytica]